MTDWLKSRYYQVQILLIAIVRPTELFDRINQLLWYKTALRQWVDDQRFKAGNTVLEMGCATGALSVYIAHSGSIVTGSDFSSNMIQRAKNKHKNIDFRVADVLDLPFKSDHFNAVIATSLINIVDDKQLAMDELTRCCMQGGMVTVLVPSDTFKDEQLKNLHTSIGESGFSAAVLNAWHSRAPKMNELDMYKLFEHAGLIHISSKQYLQGFVISMTATKPKTMINITP